MKNIAEDLHLQDLLHKIKKKQEMLDALPVLETDEEMQMRNYFAEQLYDLKQNYKDWVMRLYRENDCGGVYDK